MGPFSLRSPSRVKKKKEEEETLECYLRNSNWKALLKKEAKQSSMEWVGETGAKILLLLLLNIATNSSTARFPHFFISRYHFLSHQTLAFIASSRARNSELHSKLCFLKNYVSVALGFLFFFFCSLKWLGYAWIIVAILNLSLHFHGFGPFNMLQAARKWTWLLYRVCVDILSLIFFSRFSLDMFLRHDGDVIEMTLFLLLLCTLLLKFCQYNNENGSWKQNEKMFLFWL